MPWILYARLEFQVASLSSIAQALALQKSNTGEQITEES